MLAVSGAQAGSLRTTVEQALANHPELASLKANRRAVDEEVEAARGIGRPKVELRGSTGWVDTREKKSTAAGTTGTDFDDDTWRRQGGVTATIPVFDGWKTTYEIERSASRSDSARNRVADTANSVALQAVQAYLEVVRTSAVIAIAERNVAAHRNLLARVAARVSGGRSADADATQARARLASAQGALVEARARHRDASAMYIATVGSPPDRLGAYEPPVKALPATVDGAIAEAQRNAPSIIALMHDADAANAAIGAARSEYFPKLSVDLGANRRDDTNDLYGRQMDLSALLVVRWSLYNGGIDAARLRESRWRAEQAQHAAAVAARTIEKEIRLSWNAIQTSRERREVLVRQLEQNRRLVQAYTQQFDLGQRTLLDLLDIQNEVFINETALTNEGFIGAFSVYRVLAGMGIVVRALGLGLPTEAIEVVDRSRRLLPP